MNFFWKEKRERNSGDKPLKKETSYQSHHEKSVSQGEENQKKVENNKRKDDDNLRKSMDKENFICKISLN